MRKKGEMVLRGVPENGTGRKRPREEVGGGAVVGEGKENAAPEFNHAGENLGEACLNLSYFKGHKIG